MADPLTPDLAALRPILADLGLAPASGVTTLAGGTSAVFRLDLADGTALVLKTFAADHLAPHREASATALLATIDLPITRYLLIDESCTRLPFRFAITTHIEGTPAANFSSHPGYADLFRQIGALARQLHGVTLPAFGHLPEPPHATNAAYVRALADYSFERFVHYGADAELAARLRETIDRDFARIVPASGPAVFAHDDLQPNNVLVVERNGTLTLSGLIDFGNAQGASAAMDLAKTLFLCEHSAPGCTPAILAGYGPIPHPHPAEALAFYTLLHRVTMWWWLRHIGAFPAPDTPNDIIPALRVGIDA